MIKIPLSNKVLVIFVEYKIKNSEMRQGQLMRQV